MKRICLLFILISLCYSAFGQVVNYSNKYTLNFNLINNKSNTWCVANCLAKLKQDSTINNGETFPLKISAYEHRYAPKQILFAAFQQILLPNISLDSIDVGITCKLKNIKKAHLLVYHISADEKVFATDTLNMVTPDTIWKTSSCKLSARNMKLIGLGLLVNTYQQKEDGVAWLDKIDISLDGKSIDQYQIPVIPSFSLKDSTQIVKLSLEGSTYNNIPEIKSKKIIALGETVHGSGSINKLASQVIKHQITKNNCRLVLLELPFELMLSLNKQVQRGKGFAGDSLLWSSPPLYDMSTINDLINWITEYNGHHPDGRVALMGTDISLDEYLTRKYLCYYVKCLNNSKRDPLIRGLCKVLSTSLTNQAITYLEKHSEIEKKIGSLDYKLIKHCLESSQKAGPVPSIRIFNRDEVMFDNASLLTKLFAPKDEKVVIYSHFSHVNYGSINQSIINPTLGTRMKNKYGDKYSCLGVLLANGNILANTVDSGYISRPILSPVSNCMESCFNFFQEPVLYCNTNNFNDTFSYIRFIGQPFSVEKQFELIVPNKRMDGVIFIKESEAAKVDNELSNKSLSEFMKIKTKKK